jgi:hypothetical protein
MFAELRDSYLLWNSIRAQVNVVGPFEASPISGKLSHTNFLTTKIIAPGKHQIARTAITRLDRTKTA